MSVETAVAARGESGGGSDEKFNDENEDNNGKQNRLFNSRVGKVPDLVGHLAMRFHSAMLY